jgi:hypothetical protein
MVSQTNSHQRPNPVTRVEQYRCQLTFRLRDGSPGRPSAYQRSVESSTVFSHGVGERVHGLTTAHRVSVNVPLLTRYRCRYRCPLEGGGRVTSQS